MTEHQPPRPRTPTLQLLPRVESPQTPVPPSDEHEHPDAQELVVMSRPVVRAIFARLDELKKQIDERADRQEDRMAIGLNTALRRVDQVKGAVQSCSDAVADVQVAVVRVDTTLGVHPPISLGDIVASGEVTEAQEAALAKGSGVQGLQAWLVVALVKSGRVVGSRTGKAIIIASAIAAAGEVLSRVFGG